VVRKRYLAATVGRRGGRADRAETGGGVTNLDVSALYLDALAQHQYPRKQWQAASRYARDDR
jgi:hypothetical protein